MEGGRARHPIGIDTDGLLGQPGGLHDPDVDTVDVAERNLATLHHETAARWLGGIDDDVVVGGPSLIDHDVVELGAFGGFDGEAHRRL